MTKKLQVFVSSTYNDLKEERQAAVAAILKSGHIPAGMELFTAGDKSQLETIKTWIDQSDVYMLILGGRYGTLDPASGLSYTEVEYDYARSQGKPTFAVVITENALKKKVQAGGPDFIETMNGKLLESFRKKALSYISSFFDDEKDIKLTVHESLADFAATKELVGWVRGNTVVDTLPLFEEIKKLSEDNAQLRSQLAEDQRRIKIEASSTKDFEDLAHILKATKVTVPANVAKEEQEFDTNLLSLFIQMQDAFCTGINNQNGMKDVDQFLYFTVAPKLQIHGLVINEKVPSVRYRRYAITSKGAQFLSEVAKRKAQKVAQPIANDVKFETIIQVDSLPSAKPASAKKRATRSRKSLPEEN